MATSSHERVGIALEQLKAGLAPFSEWDATALLRLMWEGWNEVSRSTLGQSERSLSASCATCATSGRTSRPFPATTRTGLSIPPAACSAPCLRPRPRSWSE